MIILLYYYILNSFLVFLKQLIMFSTNSIFFNVTVNSDVYVQFEQITNSYDIDFNEVNRSKSNDISSRLVCENWGWTGSGSGK